MWKKHHPNFRLIPTLHPPGACTLCLCLWMPHLCLVVWCLPYFCLVLGQVGARVALVWMVNPTPGLQLEVKEGVGSTHKP